MKLLSDSILIKSNFHHFIVPIRHSPNADKAWKMNNDTSEEHKQGLAQHWPWWGMETWKVQFCRGCGWLSVEGATTESFPERTKTYTCARARTPTEEYVKFLWDVWVMFFRWPDKAGFSLNTQDELLTWERSVLTKIHTNLQNLINTVGISRCL